MYALLTKMHRCVEKSFLDGRSKLYNNLLKMEAVAGLCFFGSAREVGSYVDMRTWTEGVNSE